VGLIVDAPNAVAADVAYELRADGASATIALTGPAPAEAVNAVHSAGSDVMPRLRPGGPVRWIGTRGQLRKTARGLGINGHYYYAAPGRGFTLGQDLLGKTTGGTPLSGALKLSYGGRLSNLDRGDFVELSVDSNTDWRRWLRSLCVQMHAQGLHAGPAAQLVRALPDER
jgi:hypothetical protein